MKLFQFSFLLMITVFQVVTTLAKYTDYDITTVSEGFPKEIDSATSSNRTKRGWQSTHIPIWFLNTQICYNWYPDGDGGQCGGGAGRNLCAKVNSFTNYYRDDTDNRGGGCQMQWGIFSARHEDWFKNIQLCYRWWPDGDGGQCGGGANRLLCANVNSYTSFYRDDTDNRSGGCQMQWMLYVPSNAPRWIKHVWLCYDWYADGNASQCGGGAQQGLCAQANSYTSPYRDDTDKRSGGCQMRWAILLA